VTDPVLALLKGADVNREAATALADRLLGATVVVLQSPSVGLSRESLVTQGVVEDLVGLHRLVVELVLVSEDPCTSRLVRPTDKADYLHRLMDDASRAFNIRRETLLAVGSPALPVLRVLLQVQEFVFNAIEKGHRPKE
jgi:hypothetical protein